MKTLVCGAVALVGLAGSATASVVFHGQAPLSAVVDTRAVPESETGDTVRGATLVYDRWTNPPAVLQAIYNSGGNEIADDLRMIGGGLLCDMGINVANANGPAGVTLTGGTMNIRFYDFFTGLFISGFVANLPVVALAPGGSVRLSFGLNTLNGLGIILPPDIYASLQVATTTWSAAGPTTANAGIQIRNPGAVGVSADGMIDVTTNLPVGFGGAPLSNTGIKVYIPAPGSLALLGLGGLFAARRRR